MNYFGFVKLLLVVFFLCNCVCYVSAQKQIQYDSLFITEDGKSGRAKFQFYLDKEKKPVKNGNFNFTSTSVDSSCASLVIGTNRTGRYKANKKDGVWIFRTSFHNLYLQNVQNFSPEYTLTTKTETINCFYEEGVPGGDWSVRVDLYKDGKKTEALTVGDYKFTSALIDGVFSFKSHDSLGRQISVKGNVNKGLMKGDWIFEYFDQLDRPINEFRNYSKGFLIQLIKTSGRDTLVNIHYDLSNEILNELNLEAADSKAVNKPLSLIFNDGYPRNSPLVTEQKVGNGLISNFLSYIFVPEPDFYTTYGLPLGTNRMVYPLSKKEKAMLETWPGTERNFLSVLNELKSKDELNFKYSDNLLLRKISAWANRQDSLLTYISSWNNMLSKKEIVFYNRTNEILIDYVKDLLIEDKIVTGEDSFNVYYPIDSSQSLNFLTLLVNNFESRIIVADSLNTLYQNTIDTLLIGEEITELRAQIIQSKNETEKIYNNAHPSQKINEVIISCKNKFLNKNFISDFRRFSDNTLDLNAQLELGDSILQDMKLLKSIYSKLNNAYANILIIDSLYMEYVFDPFTFTDKVPKRVKKRLYESVAENLSFKLLELAAKSGSIIECNNYINTLLLVQERLVFLHDKDTSKLEKKLKRRDSMERKLEILQID